MLNKKNVCAMALGLISLSAVSKAQDTLPPIKNGIAPSSVEETWAGFDPRKEPLDVEVLEEWEEDGVVVKVIRFRVGTFKGETAMLAAVYGYPKGAENLPGLVQIHGGGQSAQSSFVVKDAKNGYATLSIAWAGRINATHYKVTNKEKETFWTGDRSHPDYRVTTDWGAMDAYHHHCRFKGNNFVQNPPSESTVDAIPSPRNSGWFLATMGARRAITFLEQQAQVDGDRIGVYGMSMGGKLTVLTAGADSRIKAAAPACGGISDLSSGRALPGVADDSYLERITCPTILMTPSNDFHSKVQDVPAAVASLKTKDWRVVSSPNRNHGDSAAYSVGTTLWFNQHLKGEFKMPATPTIQVSLKNDTRTPMVKVNTDASMDIRVVDVYYTQDGLNKPVDKFWSLAKPVKIGSATLFELPLSSTEKPLWIYADVEYNLGQTVEGVGYSGEAVKTDTFHLASVVQMIDATTVKSAGLIATVDESTLNEDFESYTAGDTLTKVFPWFAFDEGIICSEDPVGTHGKVIEIQDSPEFQHGWQPLLSVNTARAAFLGTEKWKLSVDMRQDATAPIPMILEFRTADQAKRFAPVSVDTSGNISTRGQASVKLCQVEPGIWWTFEVIYDLNDAAHYQIKIIAVDGTVLANQTIPIRPDMGAVNWIGFIPHGTTKGSFYIDNVNLEAIDVQLEALGGSSLIKNGSFETPNISSKFKPCDPNSSALSGWTISGKGVVLVDGFDNFGKWPAPAKAASGDQFLQLQTHHGGAGTISQDFTTTPGEAYVLKFDYSGIHPGNRTTALTYTISDAATKEIQLNITNNQLPWQTETFEFVAATGATTLSFTGEMVGGFWGASIDNVRVEVAQAETTAQPNIVVYMIDDLGWNQISAGQATMGTHSGVFQTPHLEALAKAGLSFTHAYMQPNCAPSRAAILTGQYPARVNNDVYVVGHLNRNRAPGITQKEAKFKGPEQSEDVAAEAVTIAEALQANGYATAHIGKYHVGGHQGDSTLPENQGFDINVGGFHQGHQPVCFAQEVEGVWKFPKLGRGDFDPFAEPYTNAYVEQYGIATEQIGKPKHVCDALADAMEVTVRSLSSQAQPFYLQLHAYAVHGPVKARPDLKSAAQQRLTKAQQKQAELAGFIAGMDQTLGRLMDVLADPNGDGDTSDSIVHHTLVLFTSDNGGTHFDNLPLRGVKGMFTEGGLRVPLIAHWPGVIPANTNSDHMVHAVDFYPTFLDLAGKQWQPSTDVHPLDGESFADVLLRPHTERTRAPIFYLFPGYMDARAQPCVVAIDEIGGQRYKLLYFYEADSWELYNLSDDMAEAKNLIQQHSKVASGLSKKMTAWLMQQHPTWKPKYPFDKQSGQSVRPPLFQ